MILHVFHIYHFNLSLLYTTSIFSLLLKHAVMLQENRIESHRYYELFERDNIKFGNSRYGHDNLIVYYYFPRSYCLSNLLST